MNEHLAVTPDVSTRTIRHTHSGMTEHFLTVLAPPGHPPIDAAPQIDAYLATLDSPAVLRMDIVGEVNTESCDKHQQHYCYDCSSCDLNQTRPEAKGSCPVAGMYVHAVCGASVSPIWLGGQIVGNELTTPHLRYLLLHGLQPEASLSRSDQTIQLFTRMQDILTRKGMTFEHVARTWLYLDKILDWYDEFNDARDTFFKSQSVFEKLVPASTGVGGSNRSGTAIQASVLAAIPLADGVTIEAVPSPLQCPALDYGSSFSRAVEIRTPEVQRLYISGTASIEQDGPTLHVGDVDAQIAYTMDVVHAILTSRDMDWSDLTRGVAYVKHRKDFDRFTDYCTRNNLPPMPVGIVQNDVCRDDLLFELEADAVRTLTT